MISSWLVAIGVLFYVLWSAMENTWVDPGVYSVKPVLVSFGVGLGLLESIKLVPCRTRPFALANKSISAI